MEDKNYVLVAKKEYTTVLVYTLYPAIYQGLKCIWEDSKKNAKPRLVYAEFQNRLTRVKKWNQDVIENEYKRIVDKSKCEYLEELIKRVFVINTQILAAVQIHNFDPSKKIKVQVPKGDKFIHCCYKECARAFFENALLMEDRPGTITRVEQSKNLQKAYKLIITCIENTIRNLLPIESLLKDTMDDVEGEDATPPPILFQDYSTFANQYKPHPSTHQQQQHQQQQYPQQPPDLQHHLQGIPLTSYPMLSSVLEKDKQIKEEQPPSTGSLQPSMNELGEINPQNHRDVEAPGLHRFDPDSLFAQSDNIADDERPPSDTEEVKENKLKSYEDGFKVADQRDQREEENTKTIYLGGNGIFGSRRQKSLIPREHNDVDSEDSNPEKRVEPDYMSASEQDIPVVKSRDNNMDLDVYSTTNELPILKVDEEQPAIDDNNRKDRVPKLEGIDSSDNFFSDAE